MSQLAVRHFEFIVSITYFLKPYLILNLTRIDQIKMLSLNDKKNPVNLGKYLHTKYTHGTCIYHICTRLIRLIASLTCICTIINS